MRFEGSNGLQLAGDRWGDTGKPGDTQKPTVLFLHGGGQTRHSWDGAAASVASRGWQAITLDSRGHGESEWSDDGDYRLMSFAEDVKLVIEALGQPTVLVGASLGGLASILLAGELAPGGVRAVVLVDIVPDMEPGGADRIHSFMVERADVGFGSLEEVADAIAAYNPHRPRPADLAGLSKNLRERDGRFYWHWDPKFISVGGGLRPSEVHDVDRLHAAVERIVADKPMLLVRGRASDLVTSAKAATFLERFPTVEFVDVSGAGHMVAGDRNDAFTSAVVNFLDRHAATDGTRL